MRVIVEHDEWSTRYLRQYANHIEKLDAQHKILDIHEKYLPWLMQLSSYVEHDFMIELVDGAARAAEAAEAADYLIDGVYQNQLIFATLGCKIAHSSISCYYNMAHHTQEMPERFKEGSAYNWIHCYSENSEVRAADYIKCIVYLSELSQRLNKPLLIYVSCYVPEAVYRYRTLTYKIINHTLERVKGTLVVKCKDADIYQAYVPCEEAYEPYFDRIVYCNEKQRDILKKAAVFLVSLKDEAASYLTGEHNRQDGELYDDFFYQQINLNEKIYVFLNPGNFRPPQYYEALGFKVITLMGDYGMLYAKKSAFETLREVIKLEVAHPYYISILTHNICHKTMLESVPQYSLTKESSKYKGKDIYIGVITTDDVDYTCEALRTQEGASRIVYMWHQEEADKGRHYLRDTINEALQSNNPDKHIKLPDGDSISTMMLGIAGGASRTHLYTGIATEAEFLIAKIKKAPSNIQQIYGGVPFEHAVTMPDVIIAALKLIEFAREQHKPLVLCIPFNNNVDPHDGSLILHQILGMLAQNHALTIIVPAGEEADKMHHYGLNGETMFQDELLIKVRKANQNIVGVIYQRFASIGRTILYPPETMGGLSIDLKLPGVSQVKNTIIYSNGDKISFLNGASRILFRMEKPEIGDWKITFSSQTERLSQIDIWISQEELNYHTTLQPASPFVTIGSLASTSNVMSVGGYDKENMIVLRGSGRGYSWDNRVRPLFITHASNIIAPCGQQEWVAVTGTLPAASVMLGTAAVLYSKFKKENVFPLPNTLIMNSIILGAVKQFEGGVYPNPSQGYGIFDLNALETVLAASYVF
ncbi:hypothetical protein [Cellulosilyticum sp. I15G10I2]|uniref:hypothetical protein n=1 Tax=Cellulosilyticum sp. I15G10I2 TaxID=1892843 RepID=UPI00085C889B|nr:hypothetical protein [Cellulosilyticum sp. I15G10I2]